MTAAIIPLAPYAERRRQQAADESMARVLDDFELGPTPPDAVHRTIAQALDGLLLLSRWQRAHPLVPSATWDEIDALLPSGCAPIDTILERCLSAFYDVFDGPAPPGWRLPNDPRDRQEAM